MIWDLISENLERQGFDHPRKSVRIAELLVKITEDRKMQICSVIKNVKGTDIGAQEIVEAAKHMERKFLLSGYSDVKIMHIIVTDKQEDIAYMKDNGIDFWIVDMVQNHLMIYENQPDDFYGLKDMIEKELDRYVQSRDYGSANIKLHEIAKNIPFVTIGIIIINILVYAFCEISDSTENIDFMIRMGALDYESVCYFKEYYRLIASMFLHFGFLHLANNMFMLGIVGSQVEKWFGSLRYLLIYIISGLGAGVVSLIYHMLIGDAAVSAGASGAIYGIFGAMLIALFIQRDKYEDFNPGRIIIVLVLLVFGSIQPEIDFAAHIGGLAMGIISSLVLCGGGRKG